MRCITSYVSSPFFFVERGSTRILISILRILCLKAVFLIFCKNFHWGTALLLGRSDSLAAMLTSYRTVQVMSKPALFCAIFIEPELHSEQTCKNRIACMPEWRVSSQSMTESRRTSIKCMGDENSTIVTQAMIGRVAIRLVT